MAREKTVLKVGQKLRLEYHGDSAFNVRLVHSPTLDRTMTFLTKDESLVEVLAIGHGGLHKTWIQVRSVRAPEKAGWVQFNLPSPSAGRKLVRKTAYVEVEEQAV